MTIKETEKQVTQKGLNTPYDDAFKSIISKCPSLAIYLINEMFYQNGLSDEEYTGKEKVDLLEKEIPNLDIPGQVRDMRFRIWGRLPRIFHLECQSTSDGMVALRMVRYNMTGALETAEYSNGEIHITLDDAGVLFLRSTKNTKPVMTVVVSAPQNQTLSYAIPTLKIQDYTLESMLEKKLYILLPFLFFNYESELRKAGRNKLVYEKINALYDEIIIKLKEKVDGRILNSYEAQILFEALRVVFTALGTTNKVTKEVAEIMGGSVLDFKADGFFNDGVVIGNRKGINSMSALVNALLASGDYEELARIGKDPAYAEKRVAQFERALSQ